MIGWNDYGFPDITFMSPWFPAAGLCKALLERFFPAVVFSQHDSYESTDFPSDLYPDLKYLPLNYDTIMACEAPLYFTSIASVPLDNFNSVAAFMQQFDSLLSYLLGDNAYYGRTVFYVNHFASKGDYASDCKRWTFDSLLEAAVQDEDPIGLVNRNKNRNATFLPEYSAKWAKQRMKMLNLLKVICISHSDSYTFSNHCKYDCIDGGASEDWYADSHRTFDEVLAEAFASCVDVGMPSSFVNRIGFYNEWYNLQTDDLSISVIESANLRLVIPDALAGWSFGNVRLHLMDVRGIREMSVSYVGTEYDLPFYAMDFPIAPGYNVLSSDDGVFFKRTLPYSPPVFTGPMHRNKFEYFGVGWQVDLVHSCFTMDVSQNFLFKDTSSE